MKRIEIKKGVIQNATFMTADPGHTTVDTPKGDAAKTRRSNEGTLTKKISSSYFGFKVHTKEDCDFGLIRELWIIFAAISFNLGQIRSLKTQGVI